MQIYLVFYDIQIVNEFVRKLTWSHTYVPNLRVVNKHICVVVLAVFRTKFWKLLTYINKK